MDKSHNSKFLGPLLVATVGLMIGGIDIYLPAFPLLVKEFETSAKFIQFTLVLSPLVSAIFSFIWGRKADIYSHKHLMLLALVLFGLGAAICALSTNKYIFFLGRFVQAIGGSGLSILSIVLLYDVFDDKKKQASYMALYGAMFPAVFAMAPMIGAQILEHLNWQYCFILVTFLSFLFFISYCLLLKNYSIKQRKKVQDKSVFSKLCKLSKNKEFVVFLLGHSLPISISMLFTANSSFIFQNYFCYSPIAFSIVQSIPIALNFIGSFYYREIIKKITLLRSIKISGYSTAVFGFVLSVLLFTPIPISATILIISMSVFTFYMSFSISSCIALAINQSPEEKGIAIASISAGRNFLGSSIVLVTGQFLNGTPYPMITSMFIVALFLSINLLYFCQQFKENNE